METENIASENDQNKPEKPVDDVEQKLTQLFNGVDEKMEVEPEKPVNVSETVSKDKTKTPNSIKRRNRKKKLKKDPVSKPVPEKEISVSLPPKFKGPHVQIRQNRVSVVNFPTNDDETDKQQSKQKPFKTHKHEKRHMRGMHASTLSVKYDDMTTDHTWVCIFCKKGPHKDRMGDLFGPYIIDLEEKKPNLKKPKKSIENLPTTSPDQIEMWTHEACATMTCGIYICGNKIIGLEEAAHMSQSQKCMYCQLNGATIGCLRRNCKNIGHVICTKQNGWKISENFQYFCVLHVSS